MQDRSSRPKRPRDVNQLSARIVQEATDGEQTGQTDQEKNPAAVELGRLGGKKGGPARARSLTAAQRTEIARRAAASRWRGRSPDQ
jgi:hypothetical protein